MFWRSLQVVLVTAVLVLLLVGCGSDEAPPAAINTATTSIALKSALLPGQTIAGIQLTLNFPPGVTARQVLDPNTQQLMVAPGVVQLVSTVSDSLTLVLVDYQPYVDTTGGSLSFMVVVDQGFVAGDAIQIQLDVVPSYFPVAADFSVTNLQFSDLDGNLLENLTSEVTVNVY